MARIATPDPDSRERLLTAGVALARTHGLRRLTVRGVAAAARANLGSFVYHFGTREAFVTELIERLYAPMLARLEVSAGAKADPLANLRQVLLQFAQWVIAQRDFVAHVLLDANAGEGAAQRFLASLDKRHPALLLALIARAQQAGRLRAEEPAHLMLFLMSTLAVPAVFFHLLGGQLPRPLAQAVVPYTTDMVQVEKRLDWALRALAPDEEIAR